MNRSFKTRQTAGIIALIVLQLIGCTDRKQLPVSPVSQFQFGAVTNVAELVESLVSPVPPKHPDRESSLSPEEVMANGFIHPQVQAASERLIELGTAIYPELVKHLEDDRYSHSIVVAAWLNRSVEQAIKDIMANGIEFSGFGYKSRQNGTGSNGEPRFETMVEEIGWKQYAEYAAIRHKSELKKEFVKWKLEKERRYGFTNAAQEKTITEPYINWLSQH